MKLESYLKMCGVSTVDKLSDEQVISYFTKNLAPKHSAQSVDRAVNGAWDIPPMRKEAMPLLRQAMITGQRFVCHIVECGENGEGTTHFELGLSDY